MASVFLSYAHADARSATPVAVALEKAGHSVWWDRHLRGGNQFSKEIEQALDAADVVVVLWSATSVESAWVRDEATAGRDSGRLIPTSLDGTDPPLGFRQYQTIDLSRRAGSGRPAKLAALIAAIEAVAGAPSPVAAKRMAASRTGFSSKIIGGIAVAAMLMAALGAWWMLGRVALVPTVAVVAADGSAASKLLAGNLIVQLTSQQSSKAESIRFLENGSSDSDKADLLFKVAAPAERAGAASLLLLSGSDGSILWSKDFEAEGTRPADLRQRVAVTAALALGCALDGISATGSRLDPSLRKLYLNACAGLDLSSADDANGIIPDLRKVSEEAPQFLPAWAKLLQAEAAHFETLSFDEQKAARGVLERDIVNAKKMKPDLAEADLAEIALQSGDAFLRRLNLADRAARRDPNNAYVRAFRSGLLMDVGRMHDAVDDAQAAMKMEPLSPAMRTALIGALAYSGQFAAAMEQLQGAEKLWPGATTIVIARYRLALRYGDPREALRLQRSGAVVRAPTAELFLQARIDPTSQNVSLAISVIRSIYQRVPEAVGEYVQTIAAFGDPAELYPVFLNWSLPKETPYIADILFRPALAMFRQDPRFIQVAKRLGMLDYWRKSGNWPDFSNRHDLPYDCKAEAAKLGA